ncbi:MAG: hypothetical protein JHC26_09675 [Thermofilum sp.]|uniref:hypothetical protein n=1 Tax=Thermofilum sp. TaxID=1961369 RepID=UPI0025845777|nr:hypothetical protein [Thermofilum sp.]MCI4409350.1 hypothetical protein [Thermofilum sp.]
MHSLSVKNKAKKEFMHTHFTEKILEKLRDQLVDIYGDGSTYKGVITAHQLIDMARYVPREEQEAVRNNIPSIRDFVELAKREPSALFLINVLKDDTVIVEDMLIPWDKVGSAVAVYKELEKRDLYPDEVTLAVELDTEGKRTFISPLILEDRFLAPLLKEIYKDYEVPKKEKEEGSESLMFLTPWHDIMYTDVFSAKEKEYRLTRKEFEKLLSKGKVYIRFWWD